MGIVGRTEISLVSVQFCVKRPDAYLPWKRSALSLSPTIAVRLSVRLSVSEWTPPFYQPPSSNVHAMTAQGGRTWCSGCEARWASERGQPTTTRNGEKRIQQQSRTVEVSDVEKVWEVEGMAIERRWRADGM